MELWLHIYFQTLQEKTVVSVNWVKGQKTKGSLSHWCAPDDSKDLERTVEEPSIGWF